jgi:hypothetical protein
VSIIAPVLPLCFLRASYCVGGQFCEGHLAKKRLEMLKIKNTATISDAEVFLAKLERSGTAGTDVLVCPTNWKLGHCGGMATIVQLIITWARMHRVDGGVLRSYFSEATGVGPDDLVESLPGLVGVVLARDVQKHGSSESVLRPCYQAAGRRIDRMASSSSQVNQTDFKGRRIELLCADNTSKAALPQFYVPNLSSIGSHRFSGRLRPESDFINLAKQLVRQTVKGDLRGSIGDDEINILGELLFELFENTEIHARNDEKGSPYPKSVRGVLAAFHSISDANIQKISGEFLPLQEYFKARSTVTNNQQNFFELSVFDSGPGLASRLKGSSIIDTTPIQDEYELTKSCFLKHTTSRTEQVKGLGLYRTLDLIRKSKGFLRLRTGRVSLFKSFQNIARGKNDNAELELLDAKNLNTVASKFSPVAGTIVTILIPIGST